MNSVDTREMTIGEAASALLRLRESPLDWPKGEINDYALRCARARMFERNYEGALCALAKAGRVESLVDALEPLGAQWLNWLPTKCFERVFSCARKDVLPELLEKWVRPNMRIELRKGVTTYSEAWGACIAVAMARADGDPKVLRASFDVLRGAMDPQENGASEEISWIVSAMPGIEGCSVDDYEAALRKGRDIIVEAGHRAHIPTYASRHQIAYRDNLPRSILAGSAAEAHWLECAKRYLKWVASEDLTDNDEGNCPAACRAYSMCSPFFAWPQLAKEVAGLCASLGASGGFKFTVGELPSHDASLPFRISGAVPGGSVLVAAKWLGRPIGPVDLALLYGKEDAAVALVSAGMVWDASEFVELAVALGNCLIFDNESHVAEACARAVAAAERMALDVASKRTVLAARPRL